MLLENVGEIWMEVVEGSCFGSFEVKIPKDGLAESCLQILG